ncbi:MAG: molybdopterin-dependent oxidoreductase, partial [Haloarculaceae archaeon]
MDLRLGSAVAWAVGSVAWLLGLVAAGPMVGETPLVTAAEGAVDAAPGSVATWAIETFGERATDLLVFGVGATAVAAAAAVGEALSRSGLADDLRPRDAPVREPLRVAVAVAVVALTGGALLWAGGGPSLRWIAATALALVPLAALAWVGGGETPAVAGRRRALRTAGSVAGATLGAGYLSRLFAGGDDSRAGAPLPPLTEKTATGTTTPAGPDGRVTAGDGPGAPADGAGGPGDGDGDGSGGGGAGTGTPPADRGTLDTVRRRRNVTISVAATGAPFGFDFEGMPTAVGTADSHYVVDKAVSDPRVDADAWSLSVGGAVDRPYELSFDELLDHPEARDLTVTTVCISNPVGGGLISTVDWR